jgi:dual specificity tyrosine-phosphorylation-regulated kinase 2/3/4
MTPAAALKLYKNAMSLFEQGEILDYAQVYFVGHKAKKPRATASSADNNGFDDERGDYLWNLNDHIGFRYEILGVLGKGSFGQVLKCFDWKTNQLTAFKVIRNKKRFHQQALVECKLLLQLKQRDTDSTASVVHVTDHFYFRSHMCITFEMLSINLYEFIKNNKFQGMSLSLVRRITPAGQLPQISPQTKHHSLRPQARKRPPPFSQQVLDQGHRLWVLLPRHRAALHLHPIPLLPRP